MKMYIVVIREELKPQKAQERSLQLRAVEVGQGVESDGRSELQSSRRTAASDGSI